MRRSFVALCVVALCVVAGCRGRQTKARVAEAQIEAVEAVSQEPVSEKEPEKKEPQPGVIFDTLGFTIERIDPVTFFAAKERVKPGRQKDKLFSELPEVISDTAQIQKLLAPRGIRFENNDYGIRVYYPVTGKFYKDFVEQIAFLSYYDPHDYYHNDEGLLMGDSSDMGGGEYFSYCYCPDEDVLEFSYEDYDCWYDLRRGICDDVYRDVVISPSGLYTLSCAYNEASAGTNYYIQKRSAGERRYRTILNDVIIYRESGKRFTVLNTSDAIEKRAFWDGDNVIYLMNVPEEWVLKENPDFVEQSDKSWQGAWRVTIKQQER